jgi:tetratricopeptide (TPR) repeat protein
MGVKDYAKAQEAFRRAKRFSTNPFPLKKLQEIEGVLSAQNQRVESAQNDPSSMVDTRFGQLMQATREMLKEGQIEAAEEILEEAVRLHPDDSEARKLLAETKYQASLSLFDEGKKLVDQKQHAEAYDKFDKAVRLDPENASASLGLDYVKKKLAEEERPKVIRRMIPATGSI